MHPIPVCDTLEFERVSKPGIELACSNPALPSDSSNLVCKAATAFLGRLGVKEGVRIRLEKRIPLAAGLGGGSGNAATTLAALNELFGQALDDKELQRMAADLGSDVPFFLQSRPALATGRGEIVTPVGPFPALKTAFILLIHPGFGVPTAWAYQALAGFVDSLHGEHGRAEKLIALLQKDSLDEAGRLFYNSLEAPVLRKYPILRLYQEFLKERGAAATLMSGSGSTTFALAASQSKADELLDRFRRQFGSTAWTAVARL